MNPLRDGLISFFLSISIYHKNLREIRKKEINI